MNITRIKEYFSSGKKRYNKPFLGCAGLSATLSNLDAEDFKNIDRGEIFP